MVRPASRQMSINREASVTSVVPQLPNSGPLPPKVPAPNDSSGTISPESPTLRYSMIQLLTVFQFR